jgi:hypothetical protein
MGFYIKDLMTEMAEAENSPVTVHSRLSAKTPIGAPFSHTILSAKYWDGDTKLLAYQLRDYSPVTRCQGHEVSVLTIENKELWRWRAFIGRATHLRSTGRALPSFDGASP